MRYNLDKTLRKSRRHTEVWHNKGYPNYIQETNQHMIHSKVQHKNSKTNEHEGKQKQTCSKIYLTQEGKPIIKEWDNQLPQVKQGSNK